MRAIGAACPFFCASPTSPAFRLAVCLGRLVARRFVVLSRNRKPLCGIVIKVDQPHLTELEELAADLPRVHRVISITHVRCHVTGVHEALAPVHQVHECIVDDARLPPSYAHPECPEKRRFLQKSAGSANANRPGVGDLIRCLLDPDRCEVTR